MIDYKAILGACAIAFAGSVASADVLYPGNHEFMDKGNVQGWNLFADTERKSCLIEREDKDGNVVQMGLADSKDMGYIGVFTKKDVGLSKHGEKMTILVNGNAYTGTTRARTHGLSEGYQGGYLETNNMNFVNDIKNGKELVAFPDANGVGVMFSLDGTHAAITAAMECTQKMSM